MKKRTIRIGLAILLIGLLIASIVIIYLFNKPHMNVASERPSFVMSAGQLYSEFKNDEKSANKRYLSEANGKIIQITGFVSEIIKGERGGITLSIKDPSLTDGAISCSLDSTNIAKAHKLNVGGKVVVKGQCTGYIELTNEVDLNKCVIIE